MISHRGAEIRREVNKMVSCGAALRHGQRGETRRRIALVTVAAAVLAACAAPAEHYDRTAARLGLERAAVVGGDFVHIMYCAAARLPGRRLHIYLEGDGTPLLNARIAHADPTPRMPVMLTLLVLDPRPAVLLERPCYHVPQHQGAPPRRGRRAVMRRQSCAAWWRSRGDSWPRAVTSMRRCSDTAGRCARPPHGRAHARGRERGHRRRQPRY